MSFEYGCDGCGKRSVGDWHEGRSVPPLGWVVHHGVDGDPYFACSLGECSNRARQKAANGTHAASRLPPLVACWCDNPECSHRLPAIPYSTLSTPERPYSMIFTKPDAWFMRRFNWTPRSDVVCSQACATALVRRQNAAGVRLGSDVCMDEQGHLGAVLSGRAGPDERNPVLDTDMDRPTKGQSMVVTFEEKR